MHLQIGADIDPEIIHFGIATWTADGEIFTSLVYEFKPVADIHAQTVFETTKDGNTCIAHFEITGYLRIDRDKEIVDPVIAIRFEISGGGNDAIAFKGGSRLFVLRIE